MKESEIKKLMEKVGCKVPKKSTEEELKAKLTSFLENEGIPEGLTLTDDEKQFLEDLGFEIQSEDVDVEDSDTDGEEDESEEDVDGEEVEDEDEDANKDKKSSKKSKDSKKSGKDKPAAKKEKETPAKEDKKSSKKAPKPPKNPKTGRRQLMAKCITDFLNSKKNGVTMDEIQKHVLSKDEFKGLSPLTVYTFVMDGKNPKYSAFTPLLTRDPKTGNFMFAKK